MKQLFSLIILAFTFAPALQAQGNHEYSPLQDKTVNYKNWTFSDLKDNKLVDLRSLVRGKKLVLVVYFAPWCPNWRNEAPVAARLYEKYKAQGLEVIGVAEYAARADTLAYFGDTGAPYPVVVESEGREAKTTTSHYTYRQSTGDTRNWGSPWNIFLEPAKLKPSGEVLTENAWVVNGELIEADVDKFIGERLGAKAAAIVPCKN
jgi:thiol-disulfide isomerase/thioredoxin